MSTLRIGAEQRAIDGWCRLCRLVLVRPVAVLSIELDSVGLTQVIRLLWLNGHEILCMSVCPSFLVYG